jgi:hypothetical protein
VRAQPWPVGDLRHAGATVGTIHGNLSVRWERGAGRFAIELEVPVGMVVDLRLPVTAGQQSLLEGDVPVWGTGARSVSGVGPVSADDGWLRTEVRSGRYAFELSR